MAEFEFDTKVDYIDRVEKANWCIFRILDPHIKIDRIGSGIWNWILIDHHSSSDFLLTCRYRGHIHNSGPPSRQLACCTHGRSHTRSPGVSIKKRVDSWELPLSAIPLCKLLPSHLGPPRPTLSINLYVKGCLDCTVGAFHMSIPAEPSLFQYEVQVFNSEPCK